MTVDLKTSLKRAKSRKERTLVALVFALPHLTVDQLRHLRVDEARLLTGHDLAGQVLHRLLAEQPADDFVFPSQKGRALPPRHGLPARPATPASRHAIWRVLVRTIGSGVLAFRRMLNPPPEVPPHIVSILPGEDNDHG